MNTNGINTNTAQIVLGDLDYIANPSKLIDWHNYTLIDFTQAVRLLFLRAIELETPVVSLYGRIKEVDELEIIQCLVTLANEYIQQRVLFHFFKTESLQYIVNNYNGRPILNYISGESWMLNEILPLIPNKKIDLVLQTINDAGIPKTPKERVNLVLNVVAQLESIGYKKSNIYIDTLSPSLSVLPETAQVGLDTIKELSELGFQTILWPINTVLGLNKAEGKNAFTTYLREACANGLSLAVVDSEHFHLTEINL